VKKSIAATCAVICTALVLSACSKDQEPEETAATEQPSEQTAENQREVRRSTERESQPSRPPFRRDQDPAEVIPAMDGEADAEGYGLTMLIDGSSPQAFKESLELIAMDTTSEQYQQLDAALRYLQVYSTDGWGSLEEFYQTLDGMTGEEIIERANRHSSDRGR